jgi:hypothetical protein
MKLVALALQHFSTTKNLATVSKEANEKIRKSLE